MIIKSIHHPSVLIDYEPDTICVNCGSEKDMAEACDYWTDENYNWTGQPHEWNKEMVQIPTFAYTQTWYE